MQKRLTDIKKGSSLQEEIDLQFRKKNEKLMFPNNLYKKKKTVTKLDDLTGEVPKDRFLYVKGKKFHPPKFLGNLVKIGILGFLILFLINTVNVYYTGLKLQKEIAKEATQGYSYLVGGGKNIAKIQFEEANKAFDEAGKNFSEAEKRLWFVNNDKTFYGNDVGAGESMDNLLKGGKNFAQAGTYFNEAMEELNKIPLYFISVNKAVAEAGSGANITSKPSITGALKKGLEKVKLAADEISQASEKLQNVNVNSLPMDVAARVEFAQKQVSEIADMLITMDKNFPAVLKLLGDENPHKYLILLQNNSETRPTGGFIGSYILVDIKNGYIEDLQVHDVYDLQEKDLKITPPEFLKNFTQYWYFRDSNFSSDFPTSAEKVAWFLEHSGGPKVDTVIAINQGLLKGLLEITGPVQVGNFGLLDSENYEFLLSYIIEGKIWGEEDPKHILKIFIPEFKNQLLKEEYLGKISSKLYRAVQQKHIMMWSKDEDVESLFDNVGLSGRMAQTKENEDYLSVVNFSTGGSKSDKFVEENITHETTINRSGELIDKITIIRKHQWTDEIYNGWKKELEKYGLSKMDDKLIDILGRGPNKVIMRIYVPEGSTFIEANKRSVEVKTDTKLHKTYFLTEMGMTAGKSDELKIKYKLPFKMKFGPIATYKLITEKQPGSVGSIFTKLVHVEENIVNAGLYPTDAKLDEEGGAIYATNLVYDRTFSSIWERK